MPLRTLIIGLQVEKSDIDHEENALVAPSLFDYDIVIMDVDSVFPDKWRDKVPVDEYTSVEEKTGDWFRKVIKKLSKEVNLLMEKGGMLICLLRPKRGIKWKWYKSGGGYNRSFYNNYDWIPIESLDRHINYGFGKRKKLCGESGPFGRYLRMGETYWTAYFEGIDKLNVSSRILAFNDANKPIAVEISIDKGSIVFLPLSKHPKVGEILLDCATHSFKKARERPPPSWMEKIKVPGENFDQKRLDALATEITKMQTEYDAALSAYEEKTRVKRLLYEKDEPLEEEVKNAFEELGFTLVKKDDTDWVASSGTADAILEVTGSDGSIDIDKLRQLLNYLIDDYKKHKIEKKAILVGNHFANDPIETRGEPFTEKVIGESKVHSMCLIPTLELFTIICRLREKKVKADDVRKKIFETVGIFKLS